jgi:WD40 repeat protein
MKYAVSWSSHTYPKIIISFSDLHKNTITSCKFLPKYDRIVTTSMDKTSKFYDLISNKTTLSLG